MKLKLLPIIIAASFLASSFALAATYQSEISAAYTDIDISDASVDAYSVNLDGQYYFAPVDTKNHPVAEAAFIEKASNVYINLANNEFKESGDRLDIYQRALGIDFYIPDTIFYVGAGVNQYKSNYSLPSDESFDAINFSSKWDSSWFIKAGIAPVTGLLVWSEFEEDVDVSEQWNINGKYVIPLSSEQALNIEASYAHQDMYYTSDVITAAADYYFDQNLSVGAGFINSSYDGDEFNNSENNTDYFIRARNFFTDKASLELSYYDGDYENRLMLGGTVRF